MIEKMKFIGGVDFEELRSQRIQVYNTITIDLSTARTDKEYTYTGTYLYVVDATDIDSILSVRFNEKFRGLIPLMDGRGVKAPFYRFYLTNAAQPGKSITLAIGVESGTFEVFDVGKALGITGNVNTIEVPRVGATQICEDGYAVNGETLIYTVTAGKKLYLCESQLDVTVTASASAVNAYLFVTNASDEEQYKLLWQIINSGAAIAGKSVSQKWSPAIEIPAGYKVKVYAEDTMGNAVATIQGYEV